MFENLIATLLSKTLGKYVDGFDNQRLSFSLLRGNAEFTQLRLKDGLQATLGGSQQLSVSGTIGRVAIRAMWAALFGRATIEIDVADVFVVAIK